MAPLNKKRIMAAATQYLYILRSDRWRLAEIFFWPSALLIVWGYAGKWAAQNGNTTFSAVVGAAILAEVMVQTALAVSRNMLNELNSDSMLSLFSTPVSISEWAYACIPVSLITSCIVATFSSFIAWLLFGYTLLNTGWAAMPLLLNVACFGIAIGLASTALLIYAGVRVQTLMNIFAWVLVPLAGAYYPLEVLPGWLRRIAHALPLSPLFEILRNPQMPTSRLAYKLTIASAGTGCYLLFSLGVLTYAFGKTLNRGIARLTY